MSDRSAEKHHACRDIQASATGTRAREAGSSESGDVGTLVMVMSKSQAVLSTVLQFVAAGILLQTLFFKFTGAEESVSSSRRWASSRGAASARGLPS